MDLHLYNQIFYLIILYGFFVGYNAVRGCITYVCGECISL